MILKKFNFKFDKLDSRFVHIEIVGYRKNYFGKKIVSLFLDSLV